MNTNSNSYTIIYASVMVVIVAFLLAFVSSSLKETQNKNVELDTKKQILSALKVNEVKDADAEYNKYVKADMLMNADSRITSDGSAVILTTKGLADALTYDLKEKYKVIMPWETLFEGLDVAKYNGVTIARVSIWDRMIRAYENNGTVLNKPYRAVYANINNLQTATDADGLISDLDIWFDKKERRNYVYSTGRLGTMILEDDMFHAAY